MKRTYRRYRGCFAGAAACLAVVLAVVAADRTGALVLPEALGGLLVGGGSALGALLLVNGVMGAYYAHNAKARREQAITEGDERVRHIRGLAAYQALKCSAPVYLAVWVLLLAMDVPTAALLVVCGGYLAWNGVYVAYLVKYQKEL